MHKWLGNYVQERFVLSVAVFCAVLLLLSFVVIIGYVFTQGSHYFWPHEIKQIQFIDENGKEQRGYAQWVISQQNTDSQWLGVSRATLPYQTQLNLLNTSITRLEKVQYVAEIRLKGGQSILAQPAFIQTPDSAKLDFGNDILLWKNKLSDLKRTSTLHQLALKIHSDTLIYIPLSTLESLHFPNDMSVIDKVLYVGEMLWRFLSDYPKQSNTAGGVFPALFGTLVMVLLMALFVAPFGVLAAVYMNEYAPSSTLVNIMRLCVSNMAAVPSIVYGVFGLGFLVYGVGGNIDALFFSDALPKPTLGAPGIFWASLTMALLTLPVVIVATDEGLNRVPTGLRKGSYALGATQRETILYTVIPHASPSIMTGIILAIARAAGEVAPLMLLGAVRFAPNLPIDTEFPFIHLNRQFMHLGVLIYDGAYTSQTSAKGASMMFTTCSLLILLVLMLNMVAMALRAKLRKQYQQEKVT
jgi:phosphate transport system permease protein